MKQGAPNSGLATKPRARVFGPWGGNGPSDVISLIQLLLNLVQLSTTKEHWDTTLRHMQQKRTQHASYYIRVFVYVDINLSMSPKTYLPTYLPTSPSLYLPSSPSDITVKRCT